MMKSKRKLFFYSIFLFNNFKQSHDAIIRFWSSYNIVIVEQNIDRIAEFICKIED
jgi:hypothetical protein